MTAAPNVVDSSGWLEYLAYGPNADFFAGPLAEPDNLIVTTLSVYARISRMSRPFGDDREWSNAAARGSGVSVIRSSSRRLA